MSKRQQVDYIVVGQGLAGTLVSYFLLREKQRVVVLDFPHEGRTSNIAAGLINPVTGRRIAKSWRFEELSAFAKQTYQVLEKDLGHQFWFERDIVRALHNAFEENEWLRRSSYPEFEAYLGDAPDLSSFNGKIHAPFAWGELKGCAQVAMPVLVNAWQEYLVDKALYFTENFDYQQVEFEDARVGYKHWNAKKIIFCEGSKAMDNPFFNYLPFVVTKGEMLLIKIPGCNFDRILKHNIFVIPLEAEIYWVGSTSAYEFEGPLPSMAGREWLLKELEKTLTVPFEIIDHQAGIRPTVSDIRPYMGLHPIYHSLAIFNGLGTKGALLGPFFAKQLTDFLLGNTKLEPEVDIERFENGLKTGHSFSMKNK